MATVKLTGDQMLVVKMILSNYRFQALWNHQREAGIADEVIDKLNEHL